MQPSPNNAGNQTRRSWLHRPGTILVLLVVIEILVALMGFGSRFAEIIQILAGIAGVVLIGVGVNMIASRWALSAEPDQSHRRSQFSLSQKLLLGILLVVAITFCLPIWHRHGDFAGQMHGHPIWVGEHVH